MSVAEIVLTKTGVLPAEWSQAAAAAAEERPKTLWIAIGAGVLVVAIVLFFVFR